MGKFKSFHNASDNVATNMMRTFMALLPLAELPKKGAMLPATNDDKPHPKKKARPKEDETDDSDEEDRVKFKTPGLHYNIEIHLPATKDVEVYNAIFKSLREHLIGN